MFLDYCYKTNDSRLKEIYPYISYRYILILVTGLQSFNFMMSVTCFGLSQSVVSFNYNSWLKYLELYGMIQAAQGIAALV